MNETINSDDSMNTNKSTNSINNSNNLMSAKTYESHIGRESNIIRGHFGEPLEVTCAKYSRGNATAYPAHPLLLLLHGWGSNEEDLLDLLRVVAPYNDAIALRAPLKLAEGAYSWFHDAVPQREDLDYDMYSAAAAIDEWVCENVPANRDIVPFGFSQGAALAVHVLRLNPARYRAAVSLSGFIAPNVPAFASEIVLKDDDLAERNTPVFFGYGLEDDVIPPYEFSAAAAWLEEHTWLEERRYRGLDHSVDMNEIGDIRRWFITHDISSGLM